MVKKNENPWKNAKKVSPIKDVKKSAPPGAKAVNNLNKRGKK